MKNNVNYTLDDYILEGNDVDDYEDEEEEEEIESPFDEFN